MNLFRCFTIFCKVIELRFFVSGPYWLIKPIPHNYAIERKINFQEIIFNFAIEHNI